RLEARKVATLEQIDQDAEEAFADHALGLLRSTEKAPSKKARKKPTGATGKEVTPQRPKRIAVVVNRVDLARRIFERIRKAVKGGTEGYPDKADVLLLTGRVRPLDRERIVNKLRDLKLFAQVRRDDPEKPVILVATQTVEAGADLDFDRLVTEIAPLDC